MKVWIKILSENLYKWTGKRWIITLSKDENSKTLHQSKIDEREKKLNDEKNSEIFKDVLEVFPDADLIDVEGENE